MKSQWVITLERISAVSHSRKSTRKRYDRSQLWAGRLPPLRQETQGLPDQMKDRRRILATAVADDPWLRVLQVCPADFVVDVGDAAGVGDRRRLVCDDFCHRAVLKRVAGGMFAIGTSITFLSERYCQIPVSRVPLPRLYAAKPRARSGKKKGC